MKASSESLVFMLLWLIVSLQASGWFAVVATVLSMGYAVFSLYELFKESKNK